MNQLLPIFVLLPFVGYLVSLFMPARREKAISVVAISTVAVNGLLFLAFLGQTRINGASHLHFNGPVLYQTATADFSIDFFMDRNTAVYFVVTSILTYLVLIFSRFYMHRDRGYKRFFNNTLFFYIGIVLILFSGNFETLFVGWELIGVTSFFLIAFYRERYLPVKNALKVVSLYRVADVFLLLGIWVCHHYFQRNMTFFDLREMAAGPDAVIEDSGYALLIPVVFWVVALVKSAQLPFSSWLPRAMEGPTTSSAIFYGSISVHIGVFLMLRTWPLWEDQMVFRILVISIGLLTSVVATMIAHVQSSVKTQIAYSSIAQIGLMFIEVALGWHLLALFHFASNAFLRTYQLLVSPSVLSYLIHDQFFNFIMPQHALVPGFWGKVRNSIYILSIKEWYLDTLMYRFLWRPLKIAGKALPFLTTRVALIVLGPLYLAGLYFAYHKENLPLVVLQILPVALALVAFLLILRSFVKRNEAWKGWVLVVLQQLYISLAIAFNDQFDYAQIHVYLSGIVISATVGFVCIYLLQRKGEQVSLDRFHGHSYEYPIIGSVFMVACLGLAGFPITPTFIGEDIMLGHVHENQIWLTILIALGFILDGLVIFRIYARLFLGPHEKGYHEVAYRSS